MKIKLTSAEAKVLVEELIGKQVKIINSSRQELIGIKGTIIDETMKLLTIKTKEKEIKVPKEHSVFDFNGTVIEGEKLKYRPHERIKKYWRKINGM
jgi:RNase P/RNase MRP subunit p29